MKTTFTVAVAILAAQLIAANGHAHMDIEKLSSARHEFMNRANVTTGRVGPDARPVVWSERSKFPYTAQLLVALCWVLMLSSLPFILPIIHHEPATQSQICVGVLLQVVVWGGLWLFTNIILFQSIHFDRIRPLTIVECIYFMSQVITTVGYGDITPAKPRGQVFVAVYVLGALFIISMLISDLFNHVVKNVTSGRPAGCAGERRSLPGQIIPEKPSAKPLLQALAFFIFFDITWIMFFSMHPEEGKTLFQAVYMSVITLSAVGFGWFTPVTEEGMIFGAFWMIFGSVTLVNAIGQFTEYMGKRDRYEKYSPETGGYGNTVEDLRNICGNTENVTQAEFIRLCLLHNRQVSESTIDDIMSAFNNLKPKDGKADLKAIERDFQDAVAGLS
jgi:hypothetical protein